MSSWVRKAIQRHVDDLTTDHKVSGIKFDRERAIRALKWINKNASITEDGIGVGVGDKLRLQDWQQAFIWILFGWRRVQNGFAGPTDTRRFRYVYAELARGNGKSKLASVIALYVLIGEGIRGSNVFSIATKMEQAKIVYSDSALMVQNGNRHDLAVLQVQQNLIFIPGTATVYRPLASNENSLDGLKPNLIVVDELHAHRTRGPWNKCKTALGKKPGSMMLAITTAGYDRESVCYEQRLYAEKVLDGIIVDYSYFAWIAALDEGDDPFDPANWPKANPNLNISIELQTLIDAAQQAQEIPTEYNEFLRLRCNIWTESSVRWMPMDRYDLCNHEVDKETLKGRPCIAGVDLSTVSDISAVVLVFPPWGDDPYWRVMPFFYVPADNVKDRVKKDRVPYDEWIRKGFVTPTPGAVIDFDYIRKHINELHEYYEIKEISYDKWNAHQISTQLERDGFTMVEIRQGNTASMNSPMKFLMERVLKNDLAHGGNPVLRWMMSNTVADMDSEGNIRPDKGKSTEKIDGVVAMINAFARASVVKLKKKQAPFKPQVW